MGNVFKKAVTLVSLMGALGSTSAVAAEYSVLAEIMPGNVLLSSEFGAYSTIKNPTQDDPAPTAVYDEFKNGASYMPTLAVGFEIDTDYWRYHLIGGIGQMQNEAFKATIIKYEAAMYYTGGLQTGFAFGPHIVNYNILTPSWEGDTHISLSGTNAIAPGLAFTVGDKFVIKGSIDYLMGGTMDVSPDSGHTLIAGEDIKLDGVMVQLGAMVRF
ncbi:MAG: hypothetical protein U9N52_12895 [Campylobacterota bacterium]|nr:hypothetical protein [Campylobacterota bacterium]